MNTVEISDFYVVSEQKENKQIRIVRVLYARRDYAAILNEELK